MDDLIRADTGERVQLGAQLGSTGGEGSVHQTNFPGLAAKKFTRSEGGRRKKLDWMLQNSPPDDAWTKHRFRSIAWPVALIVDRKSRRKLRGYLMPAILGGCHPTALWSAYGRRQDDRRRGFDWQYLHLAARNLSSVVDALHRNGVVIGDVKPENIFVQLNGGITIIDTDSFQVRDRGTLHPCRRVSLPYISPEAAGWKAGEPLTPEHDRFALAILIFQVLLGGWHPFGAGHYDGANADSPSIQNLIVEGQWLFKTGTRLSPNPKTQFPIDILHPGLTALFERAFNDGHRRPDRRPSASEWRGAVDVAHNDLARCNERRNHYYSASSRDAKSRSGRPCYWCERAHTIPNGDAFAPLFDQPNRTTGARQRVRANPNARAAPLGAAAGIRRPMAAAIAGPVALPVAAHTRHLLQRVEGPGALVSGSRRTARWRHRGNRWCRPRRGAVSSGSNPWHCGRLPSCRSGHDSKFGQSKGIASTCNRLARRNHSGADWTRDVQRRRRHRIHKSGSWDYLRCAHLSGNHGRPWRPHVARIPNGSSGSDDSLRGCRGHAHATNVRSGPHARCYRIVIRGVNRLAPTDAIAYRSGNSARHHRDRLGTGSHDRA